MSCKVENVKMECENGSLEGLKMVTKSEVHVKTEENDECPTKKSVKIDERKTKYEENEGNCDLSAHNIDDCTHCKVKIVATEYADLGQEEWKMTIKTEDDVKKGENDKWSTDALVKIEETEIRYEENENNCDISVHDIYKEIDTTKAQKSTNGEETNVQNKYSRVYVLFRSSDSQTQELTDPTSSPQQNTDKDCLTPPSKDPCNVPTYDCDKCDYVTKHRSSLHKHKLRHHDPSNIRTFKCKKCPYESKFKKMLARHQQKHGTKEVHKCQVCGYEAPTKSSLVTHEVRHKPESETTLYGCDECEYKTKVLADLKRHQIIHKDPSEIPIYKCESCEYVSKRKDVMKLHLLRHTDVSKVRTFKCDRCDYQSKYKQSLVYHQLKHANPSEVTMYTCGKCSFASKYKGNLSAHRRTHESAAGAGVFK